MRLLLCMLTLCIAPSELAAQLAVETASVGIDENNERYFCHR
jgi:hypothetical protein